MKEANINGEKVHIAMENGRHEPMGILFWYTVGGCRVPIDKFKEKWRELNLNEEDMPKDPRPPDIFKQATKSVERDETIRDGEETYIATYIVESSKVSPRIRHLVRLLKKNEKEKPFDTTDIGEWELNDKDEIVVRAFVSDHILVSIFNQFSLEVKNVYENLKNYFTENDIRYVLKECIHRMPYIILRPSGGVYFVPIECIDTIKKFSELLKWIQESYGTTAFKSELWYVPVVKESRDLIYEKFQDDVIERLDKMYKEATAICAGNDIIYPCKYREFCETFEHIVQTYDRYKEMLNDEINTVQAKMEILKQAIFQELSRHVKGA